MSTPTANHNRRILVIDDNPSIHSDFRKILCPAIEGEALNSARAALFGDAPTMPIKVPFEIDSTDQGQKGLGLVDSARRDGQPYALAFVDMRMPPGWDGLETIEHLWYSQPDLEIVICTAYTDHPWDDVAKRIGQTDKLLILMKPFNSIEVIQLANSLTAKWNLKREIQVQLEHLAACVAQRTTQVQEANERAQQAIARRITGGGRPSGSSESAAGFQAKEEFLAIMSHELLTPMNALAAKATELLGTTLDPAQRGYVVVIQQAAQDMMALIGDMHQFMTAPPAAVSSSFNEASPTLRS